MKKESRKVLAIASDFRQTFETPHGKNVLSYLMKRSGFLNTSFVQGDPYLSAFNEGQRALVIDICNKLKTDIKKLESALLEQERVEGERDEII